MRTNLMKKIDLLEVSHFTSNRVNEEDGPSGGSQPWVNEEDGPSGGSLFFTDPIGIYYNKYVPFNYLIKFTPFNFLTASTLS